MSTPQNPRPESTGTYFVPGRSHKHELGRIQFQDQLFTASMGGVLPELPDPPVLQRVLDVGCGTGGWLIELARHCSTIRMLVGVDINTKLIDFARIQATTQQMDDRVQFHVMDALRKLEFPSAYFDLLNQRMGSSYLRTWDWPKLIQAYQHILQPEGLVRITENHIVVENTSPALTQINLYILQALYQAGYLFTPKPTGITDRLTLLLQQQGFQEIQTHQSTLECRSGTPEGQHFVESNKLFLQTILPFLRKWTRVPEAYEKLSQQALIEMQQPGFLATYRFLTVWGKNKKL